MQYLERLAILLIFLFTLGSCENRDKPEEKDYFIEWDNSSLVCIAEEGAYPRLKRVNDGSLLAVYENRRGDVVINSSNDEAVSWLNESIIYEAFDYTDFQTGETTRVNIANPEITELTNGDLLLAVNLRPATEGIYPFSIALKRSSDNGISWSDAEILFQAEKIFRDGCWEPSFLLLPDGNIHIYFANEFPYQESDEQEISVLISNDNGITWSPEPKTVSFRKDHRDGMPVAVHDGENIYVVIEDNVSGQFKPWIVKGNVKSSWNNPVLEDSSNRYSALKNRLPDNVYAGAPYLIKTDSGIYVISYQTTENRSSNWELSTMEVVISENPHNFRNPSRPFNVSIDKEAKWNSLADLGNNRVAALASTNLNNNKIGIWMIKGEIVHK